nr:DUF3043 domain-containing protein [Isoptericola variabilis]
MFSRKRDVAEPDRPGSSTDGSSDAVRAAAESEQAGRPGSGKGRPTPKRSVAQAANKRPLVPNDRRVARQQAKAKLREQRNREYQAMLNGDETHMPLRDRGPVKRYVRDYVDARWNLGEFFLPIAFVFIVINLFATQLPELAVLVLLALYLVVLLTIADAIIMWRGLKKRLVAKFGEVPRGTAMYAVMRAFQLRRSRLPRPTSKKHGNYPS